MIKYQKKNFYNKLENHYRFYSKILFTNLFGIIMMNRFLFDCKGDKEN